MKRVILGVVLSGIIGGMIWAHRPPTPLPAGVRADRVVVRKMSRTLELYQGSTLLRAYPIALGPNPLGHKEREGDGRTPDGQYVLDYRNPASAFHKALHVSYPSAADAAAARSRGVDPGGLIMIHGIRNGLGFVGRFHTLLDWTNGCIAVTNREIDEIWQVVADGTPISIEP